MADHLLHRVMEILWAQLFRSIVARAIPVLVRGASPCGGDQRGRFPSNYGKISSSEVFSQTRRFLRDTREILGGGSRRGTQRSSYLPAGRSNTTFQRLLISAELTGEMKVETSSRGLLCLRLTGTNRTRSMF